MFDDSASNAHFVWDQHCCIPLSPDADATLLQQYSDTGARHRCFVSVNVGYAPHDTKASSELIASYSRTLAASGDFEIVDSVSSIESANANNRIAVAFDLEDSAPLEGDLDRVADFYNQGVRSLVPTYNYQNAAGSGCMDTTDTGLTGYGRDLVRQLNSVGMTVDASHCSARSGLQMCELSDSPIIYSHTGFQSVYDCPRNISDDQARACSATGGVVGILGIGIFLGENDASIAAMMRHLEYALNLVGPDHVGIGSDYNFDLDNANAALTTNPECFPDWFTKYGPIKQVDLPDILGIGEILASRGYPQKTIEGLLGGNFKRIAQQNWRTPLNA